MLISCIHCSDSSMWLLFRLPLSQIVRLTLKYEILWLPNNIIVTSQKIRWQKKHISCPYVLALLCTLYNLCHYASAVLFVHVLCFKVLERVKTCELILYRIG